VVTASFGVIHQQTKIKTRSETMKAIEVEVELREVRGKLIADVFVEQDISKEDAKVIAKRIKKAVERRYGKTPIVKISKKVEDVKKEVDTEVVEKVIKHLKNVLDFEDRYSVKKASERTLKILKKEEDPEVAHKLSVTLAIFIGLEESGMEAVKSLTLYGFREEKITDSYIKFLSSILRNGFENSILYYILTIMENMGLDNTSAYNLAYDILKQERD